MQSVFLDRGSLDLGDLDLDPLGAVLPGINFHAATGAGEAAARIRDADVVITNKVMLDAAAIAAATRLKLICVAATGTNNIDLDAARTHGVTVSNCRGYGTPSVAQHALTLMLALATRLPDYQRAVAEGRWARATQFCLLDYPIRELAGKTLGIVGQGELGGAVAHLGEAFGMRVLRAARPGAPGGDGRVALADLLAQVDVLSLHCPLTAETRHLIGAAELARMKPDALLINTARGGLVDEVALADALRAGRIGGAGFDVLTEEPPVRGNPLLAPDLPNLIITPHNAWGSRESRQRMVGQLAENIRGFLVGNPQRVVA